jgi:hypothetical protein
VQTKPGETRFIVRLPLGKKLESGEKPKATAAIQ